ncbi:MAG: ADP-forming succinate--CoA ligase subunit beta [Planctomycetes bacterium]|nr:ADP-forming succinate--CoA ligase subunit beta [Planctomycetota bacterium]MCB9918654.1 ADP-forming succinate--CoA ligase subunit beta [Planctomycetota bacterium]
MKIHEYQAKQLLARFGVAVSEGVLVTDAKEAGPAWDQLGTPLAVVKAQIHAGGRGKGGGVKLARSREETIAEATRMLGMNLVTHQTGPEGKIVQRVWIEKGSDIARELYLAMTVDRVSGKPVMMASREGGVEIEEVAAKTPEKIFKETIEPCLGMQPYQARNLAFKLGLEGTQVKEATKIILGLARCFLECDCSIAEINPLIVTTEGNVKALDAKINFDDNALYRHKDLEELRDLTEEDAKEIEASKYDLNYIALDGNIGCMVNGAGLAMATMDVIKAHGGEPANFLDVGGSVTKEGVVGAFKILLSDKNVEAIMINIFGGIAKCDVIAQGVVDAAKEVDLTVPLVVRLEGTNVKKGRQILEESDIALISATSLDEAAKKAVEAAGAAR